MYSNDYNQIRNGLNNYVGSLLMACPFEGMKASRQYVAATLIEEAMKLMKNEDNTIELYVTKPLLRGTNVVLKDRVKALSALPKNIATDKILKYNDCIDTINELINSIPE